MDIRIVDSTFFANNPDVSTPLCPLCGEKIDPLDSDIGAYHSMNGAFLAHTDCDGAYKTGIIEFVIGEMKV